VSGIVERGAGRGRTIGIPTANIRSAAETVPARGVYAGIATVHGARYAAAVNIGLNPTFTDGQVMQQTIEAHLLNVPEGEFNIYGDAIRLEFIERLRDEKKFASVQELVTQIKTDVAHAEKIAGKLIQDADDNSLG
jgi:riboflavin kinase/FMN adenylyltransferase